MNTTTSTTYAICCAYGYIRFTFPQFVYECSKFCEDTDLHHSFINIKSYVTIVSYVCLCHDLVKFNKLNGFHTWQNANSAWHNCTRSSMFVTSKTHVKVSTHVCLFEIVRASLWISWNLKWQISKTFCIVWALKIKWNKNDKEQKHRQFNISPPIILLVGAHIISHCLINFWSFFLEIVLLLLLLLWAFAVRVTIHSLRKMFFFFQCTHAYSITYYVLPLRSSMFSISFYRLNHLRRIISRNRIESNRNEAQIKLTALWISVQFVFNA